MVELAWAVIGFQADWTEVAFLKVRAAVLAEAANVVFVKPSAIALWHKR